MLDFILQYWIHFLFGVLISLISYLVKTIRKHKQKIECNKKAIALLLKAHIIDSYDNLIDKKTIEINEKNNFNTLYDSYICFQKNQIITDLYDKIASMPIE